MRGGIILLAGLAFITTTSAQADEWCGYAAREKSMIECGYSSVTECESAIGKGGMCFVDPDYALNVKGAPPNAPASVSKSTSGRS
jgi:hypothetical protein